MKNPGTREERTTSLRWVHRDSDQKAHELLEGDRKVASLRWPKGEGTLAVGEWGERTWSFKRFGFFHPKITIRAGGSEASVGRFEPNMSGGGILHAEDGLDYRLLGNFWRGEWNWVSGAGREIAQFKRDFSVQERAEGHVSWVAEGVPEDRRQLLILFGWYVVIMLSEDAAQSSQG